MFPTRIRTYKCSETSRVSHLSAMHGQLLASLLGTMRQDQGCEYFEQGAQPPLDPPPLKLKGKS